jgi:hypothetical protein
MDNINLNDWIGPFLMKPTSTSMGFWVYKDNPPFGDMRIVIKDKHGKIIDELPMLRDDNSLKNIGQINNIGSFYLVFHLF